MISSPSGSVRCEDPSNGEAAGEVGKDGDVGDEVENEVFDGPGNAKSKKKKKKKKNANLLDGVPDKLLNGPEPRSRRGSLQEIPFKTHKPRTHSLGDRPPVSFGYRVAAAGDYRVYGEEFSELAFPIGWDLPSMSEFRRKHNRVDVASLLGQVGVFGNFDGSYGQYPAWKKKFYRLVHVQNTHVAHKCDALDQSVSDKVRNWLFEDLEDNAEDYLARIQRLERRFGGQDRGLDKLGERIRDVRHLGPRETDRIEKAIFALEKVLKTEDPRNGEVLRIIKRNMRWEVLQGYNSYLWDKNVYDKPLSVLNFLRRHMDIQSATSRDCKMNLEPKRFRSRKGLKGGKKTEAAEKKDNTVTKKADNKGKKGENNYQFFKAPCSGTSSSSSEESSEEDSDESETEDSEAEYGRLHAQKGKEVCYYCEDDHDIFRCDVFCCQLTAKERRAWAKREGRCLVCFRPDHAKNSCGNKRSCRFCGGPHNSLVHVAKDSGKKKEKSEPNKKKTKTKTQPASSESEEGRVHSSRCPNPGSKTSLTTFVTRISHPESGQVLWVNALADSGADHTVLSCKAAKSLGLWRENGGRGYKVKGHGGSSEIYSAQDCDICLLDPDGSEVRQMKVKSYESPCGDLKIENWEDLKTEWKHLRNIPLPRPVGNGEVDLILGSSALDLMEAVRPAVFGPPWRSGSQIHLV